MPSTEPRDLVWRDAPCFECQEGIVRQTKELKGTLAGECNNCGLHWAIEELIEGQELWERMG